ncbi:MAG: Txe/YoeB family addiction module toxin [Coriobacteriales bacterium]|nr:Txe/YoeB family addiction module toxin [Coriobacteriales bacterium]
MSYEAVIKSSAKSDLRKLKGTYLQARFLEIVEVLKTNPYSPTGSFGKLLPYSEGLYSRRLNHQHRVVYCVNEPKKRVEIFAA